MARVLALIPDLLFGSTVHGALTGAGHQVELVSQLPPKVDADVRAAAPEVKLAAE